MTLFQGAVIWWLMIIAIEVAVCAYRLYFIRKALEKQPCPPKETGIKPDNAQAVVPVIVDKFAYVTLPDPMAGRKDVYTLYKIPLFGNHRVKIIGREITLDIVNKLIRQAKEQP